MTNRILGFYHQKLRCIKQNLISTVWTCKMNCPAIFLILLLTFEWSKQVQPFIAVWVVSVFSRNSGTAVVDLKWLKLQNNNNVNSKMKKKIWRIWIPQKLLPAVNKWYNKQRTHTNTIDAKGQHHYKTIPFKGIEIIFFKFYNNFEN